MVRKKLVMLKVICAWCNDFIRWQLLSLEDREKLNGKISHGICECCYQKQLAEIKEMGK